MNKFFVLLASVFLFSNCMCAKPVEGEKVGHVVKLAHEGYLIKTVEGQLVRGSMSMGGGAVGLTPFDFTVVKEEHIKVLEQAMHENKEVSIHYQLPWVASAASREAHSDGIITSVVLLQ